MVEQKDGTQNHPFAINNILPIQHVKVFQMIAGDFGIKISILAVSGQPYEETRLDQEGNEYTYEGTVPEGNLKVEITSPTKNLNAFYNKAIQVIVKMQTQRKTATG